MLEINNQFVNILFELYVSMHYDILFIFSYIFYKTLKISDPKYTSLCLISDVPVRCTIPN